MLLTKAGDGGAESTRRDGGKGEGPTSPYRRNGVKNACHFSGKMTAAQRKGMGQRWMLSAGDEGGVEGGSGLLDLGREEEEE